ncbi:MAG TPA: hypothetical protein VJX74_02545, partial [Blastocatellia bacterium]|nr:hypothetical protein [Blastocatellia bacterium]
PDFSLVSPHLGELRFNLDFAKLPGIASSSETVTKDCMVRINTDKSTAAVVQMVRMLKPGDPSLEVETLDRKKTLSATNTPVYVCQIGYQLKQELNAVLIGDAASGFKRMSDLIYIPTANPQNVSQVQVCSVDLNSLATKPSATFTGKGIFSLPNSIDISDDKVFAMFGDTTARLFDNSLQPKGEPRQFKCGVVTGMKTSGDDEIYVLATNIDQTNLQSIKYKYSLMRGHAHPAAGEPSELLTLDSVRGVREQNRVAGAPAWVTSLTNPPMAIEPIRNSQIGRKVAICIEGGLIVIESRSEKIDVIALEGTGREEAILFDNVGDWIYCAHSEPNGMELKISRVNTRNLREKHKTILLPTKETISPFIMDIRSAEARQGLNRSQRAASLGMSLYNTPLFVSHGRTILQLDTQSMTVRRSATVELPCRLMYVTQDRSFCWMVYAMGATGSSDGSSVKEYKTHLYKLAFARDV